MMSTDDNKPDVLTLQMSCPSSALARRSGFCGHGKKKLLQQVITESEARELLELAGESVELRNKVKTDMKTFVLSKVYSHWPWLGIHKW